MTATRNPARIIIVVAAIGAVNAVYLTFLFAQSSPGNPGHSFCDINETASCSNVVTSKYALFLGVPVCTIALFVYPALVTLGVLALSRSKTRNIFYAVSILSAMGFMLNVVYIYNEVVYIKAICILCLACTVLIATAFGAGLRGYLKSVA